jgi:proteic killer suppression protein
MIRSFRNKETAWLFQRIPVPSWGHDIQHVGLRKLRMLDAATTLQDLRALPGNRLERLSGDRVGTWSIRVSRQWRVCFRWVDGDAFDVELVDYH